MKNFRIEFLFNNKKVNAQTIIPEIDEDDKDFDAKRFLKSFAKIPVQTHSLNVGMVKNSWERFENIDSLVTFEKDLPIGICTADCVPILLYASDVEGVAAIHAGWKGTLGGIIEKTLDVLEEYGAKSENMSVMFGPSISPARYEVDKELADKFISSGFGKYISFPNGENEKPHLDLQGINMERLLRRGVKKENIMPHSGCSFDSKDENGKSLYCSYRRSGGSQARMLTSIMLV